MKDLSDIQVKMIMNAFVTHADMIEKAEKEAFRTRNEAEPYPQPDLDLWVMYDPKTDAYDVQFMARGNIAARRQPILCDFHHEAGRYLALLVCTCADMPKLDWEWHSSPYAAAIDVWREALLALREWTLKPRKEQIEGFFTTCSDDDLGNCTECMPKHVAG